jgi:adenylate cyclase class 2
MSIEIEAKLKVDSLQEIAEKLTRLGAEFIEEQMQKDHYFDDADSSLLKTDRCLRVRTSVTGPDEKMFLTYKGPKEKTDLKKRQEIELELADSGAAGKLLSHLGYKNALAVEKKRSLWRLDDCLVALDHLPLLGNFVEIEGPNEEKIKSVQESLGLQHFSHIPESYASLILNKKQ